jgi:hypothetical protein
VTVIPKVERQCRVCGCTVLTGARNLKFCDACRREALKTRARKQARINYHLRKVKRGLEKHNEYR